MRACAGDCWARRRLVSSGVEMSEKKVGLFMLILGGEIPHFIEAMGLSWVALLPPVGVFGTV